MSFDLGYLYKPKSYYNSSMAEISHGIVLFLTNATKEQEILAHMTKHEIFICAVGFKQNTFKYDENMKDAKIEG